ncbi:hypothetical protein L6R52_33480 [Myxococcota bacterium]|nr:hypothetical protein [Myxococcota bacterium]
MSALVLSSIVAALVIAAPGEAPKVHYTVKVVTKSWQPLELTDVEKMIEAKALGPLTAPGVMRLERSSFAELKGGDYSLTIDGRFIEEAEKLSVYLTFGPGSKSDLPSFHVSDTESLGGLARDVMQRKIEVMAERAGQRMAEVLAPVLESVRLQVAPPPLEDPALPWTWGAIELPRATAPTKALKTLLEVRNPDHERHKALTEVKSQVFDQPAARDVVVLCMLRDPTPGLRARCAEALAPVARTHVPTQRIILHAMRQEVDDEVLRELTSLARTFVGLSRKECIETWLELVASDATPAQSASHIADVLADEGDVPNLDFAVAKCLQQEALVYGKKAACAQHLLRVIPAPRRRAVVWRYLENVRFWEQGETNVFGDVVATFAGRGSEPLEPAIAELFLSIAERRSAGLVRDDALYVAMRHAAPTPAIVERILKIASAEPHLVSSAMRAILELTDNEKSLAPMTLGALKRMQAEGPVLRQKHGGDPNREVREAIDRLEKRLAREGR